MGSHNDFDNQLEGQLTLEDIFDPPEKMIAVSNIFARARKQMSIAEQKTFVFALSLLKWTVAPNQQSNIVKINKKELAEALGYKSNVSDQSQNMWKEIKDLAQHSYIEISDRDRGIYDSGMFITRISMSKYSSYIRIKFEDEYFNLFTGLGKNYITMWSADIFKMSSRRSIQFYELLRQMSFDRYKVGKDVYSHGFGIKSFKEMFGIPMEGKGSYMRGKDGFDRSNFEKKVIDPLCEDLSKCRMIQLILQPDGKFYEKVKRGNRVEGYRFYWTYTAHPAVATASEVARIQEKVDEDPQVLKIAKDIVAGQKKPRKKKAPKKPDFANYQQRTYDFGELERMLLEQQANSTDKKG